MTFIITYLFEVIWIVLVNIRHMYNLLLCFLSISVVRNCAAKSGEREVKSPNQRKANWIYILLFSILAFILILVVILRIVSSKSNIIKNGELRYTCKYNLFGYFAFSFSTMRIMTKTTLKKLLTSIQMDE